MVIAFLAFGVLTGAIAGGVTFWSSGSILLALASYSAAGTLGGVAVVALAACLSAGGYEDSWRQTQDGKAVSA